MIKQEAINRSSEAKRLKPLCDAHHRCVGNHLLMYYIELLWSNAA